MPKILSRSLKKVLKSQDLGLDIISYYLTLRSWVNTFFSFCACFVSALVFIHRIVLRIQLHIESASKRTNVVVFRVFFLDYFFIIHQSRTELPILIDDRERTALKWSDRHRTNSELVGSLDLTNQNIQIMKFIDKKYF